MFYADDGENKSLRLKPQAFVVRPGVEPEFPP